MVGYNFMKKLTAKKLAVKKRKMGYEASMYKKKKGYGVSVTKK